MSIHAPLYSLLASPASTSSSGITTLSLPIVIAIAIMVAAAICASFLAYFARARRIVRETSAALSAIGDLNARFIERVTPLPILAANFTYRATSKANFDRFDLNEYARSCVLEREYWFASEIEARKLRAGEYASYSNELMAAGERTIGRSSDDRVKPSRYNKIEQRLFHRSILARPTPIAQVVTTATYTSPQGRNSYRKHTEWGFATLQSHLQTAQAVRAQRSTTTYLRAQERRLLTPSLRADILRRDASRCRMCGASASDGVVLHIDHVVPVSHGGRTVSSNLQTLCQSCNLGKSNRFSG